MKKLVIIGARNFGREVYSLAKQCQEHGTQWEIAGFLDDDSQRLDSLGYPVRVLGSVESHEPSDDELFVSALGDPSAKESYVNMITQKGGVFTNLIHPTVILNENVSLGTGVIIQPFCLISNDVRIEDHVTLQAYCTLGHDVHCQAYCHLSAYTFLGGGVKMGRGTFTGTRATILPKMSAGDRSRVGANSLVVRDVPPGANVFGSPAASISQAS